MIEIRPPLSLLSIIPQRKPRFLAIDRSLSSKVKARWKRLMPSCRGGSTFGDHESGWIERDPNVSALSPGRNHAGLRTSLFFCLFSFQTSFSAKGVGLTGTRSAVSWAVSYACLGATRPCWSSRLRVVGVGAAGLVGATKACDATAEILPRCPWRPGILPLPLIYWVRRKAINNSKFRKTRSNLQKQNMDIIFYCSVCYLANSSEDKMRPESS